jgi:hypothetical protein
LLGEGNETSGNGTNSTKKKKAKPTKRLKPVRKVINSTTYSVEEVQVGVESTITQAFRVRFTKEEVEALQEPMLAMDRQEEATKQRAETKNSLESSIYQLKDYSENKDIMAFATEAEKAALEKSALLTRPQGLPRLARGERRERRTQRLRGQTQPPAQLLPARLQPH